MLDIVQTGDPVLRRVADPVPVDAIASDFIQQLIVEMRDTMRAAPGVGLAAPQIGVPLRIAVIEDPGSHRETMSEERLAQLDRRTVPFQVLINPVVEFLDDESIEFFEGCLSVSGYQAVVSRTLRVRVQALDENAEPVSFEARGWHARIVQHELDHLNGILYIDRMDSRTFTDTANAERFLGPERDVAELDQA